eukprot:5724965-Amphidinium_carterae.3
MLNNNTAGSFLGSTSSGDHTWNRTGTLLRTGTHVWTFHCRLRHVRNSFFSQTFTTSCEDVVKLSKLRWPGQLSDWCCFIWNSRLSRIGHAGCGWHVLL